MELHQYKSKKRGSINLINIFDKIFSSKLCVEFFHEGFFYRSNQYGGDRYKVFDDIKNKYKLWAYKPELRPNKYKNTFFHYQGFRVSSRNNFRIWDFLQGNFYDNNYSARTLNFRDTYLKTINDYIKLANAYYLSDDFVKSIKALFPNNIINALFDFSTLKKYKGRLIHPVRKQILESGYKNKIINFLNRHINNLKKSTKKEIFWYFQQPTRANNHNKKPTNKNIPHKSRYWVDISLFLGDIIEDTYVLGRMLKYMKKRNTNIMVMFGGWAHPDLIGNFFREEMKSETKLYKEFGERSQLGHFDRRFFSSTDSLTMPANMYRAIFDRF